MACVASLCRRDQPVVVIHIKLDFASSRENQYVAEHMEIKRIGSQSIQQRPSRLVYRHGTH